MLARRGQIGSRLAAAQVEAQRSIALARPPSTDRFTGLMIARLRRHEFADMVGVAELATVTDDLSRVAARAVVLLQLTETADKLARVKTVLERRGVIHASIQVVAALAARADAGVIVRAMGKFHEGVVVRLGRT